MTTTIVASSSWDTREDLVDSFFIPNSPNETNLTALEDSIGIISIMLEGEGGGSEMLFSPFASCKPTAQVHILTSTKPFWTLKTFDQDGRAKLVGGDEFYIVYNRAAGGGGAEIKEKDKEEEQQRDPTAVALIHDNGDGSYTLDFVTTPMKPNLATDKLTSSSFAVLGNLTVYFDYTCNIGSLAPPSKKMWKNNGSTSIAHTISTMQQQPPIRMFQHAPRPANLSAFAIVNFIGASTMKSIVLGPNGKPFRKNTILQNNFKSPLNTTTVDQFWACESTDAMHGNAVILGSDIWDILSNDPNQGPGFQDHLAACARVVELGRRLFPNTTLMWKSPTAMHILRLPRDCNEWMCTERVRYMSATRTKFLYDAQKALMKTLKVPFWDLYQATYLSAFRTRPGDGRHYHRPFNKMISNYLFNDSD